MYVVVNLQEIMNFFQTTFFVYNILTTAENLYVVFSLVVITNWKNVGGHIEICVAIVCKRNN